MSPRREEEEEGGEGGGGGGGCKKQGVLPEDKPVFTLCTETDTRVKDKPLSRETVNICPLFT